MRTPNRNPKTMLGIEIQFKDPSKYTLVYFLLYSWNSLFGVPIPVLLVWKTQVLGPVNASCSSQQGERGIYLRTRGCTMACKL